MLKYTQEVLICVEYRDLERFILEETGHEYEVIANEEFKNDSVQRYRVEAFKSSDWEEFKSTGEQKLFRLRDILNGLCAEDKIPAGKYLVSVCW